MRKPRGFSLKLVNRPDDVSRLRVHRGGEFVADFPPKARLVGCKRLVA
jgi:hypothetical protein